MTETQWVPFSAQGFKRKRAELACAFCHSKKIRCDVQVKRRQGLSSCTNCSSSGRDCCTRPSKRKNQPPHPPTPPTDTSNLDPNEDTVVNPGNGSRNSISSSSYNSNTQPNRRHSVHVPEHAVHVQEQGVGTYQWPVLTNNAESSVIENNNLDHVGASSENWILENSGTGLVAPNILQITSPGNASNGTAAANSATNERQPTDPFQADLQQSFIETYFDYCYTWCPILDRSTLLDELVQSPLLDDALAVAGSHIRPPLIPHPEPATYYDRARRRFYEDEEDDLMTSLKAVLLFYWWAPRSQATVHKHSSWWWTSVVIKHAQQAGFHHEAFPEGTQPDMFHCFKRRVWWTAFARERLTAICQGKPCLIDPEDCNIPEPSLDDFPDLQDKQKAEVFIYWVKLCGIIGRIAKELSRAAQSPRPSPFPEYLGRDLIQWIQSLPAHLQLPIKSSHTPNFQLDVHQLHLPYLAVIVVLHLTRSSQSTPQALPPATLAASCIARILKDILLRRATSYLMPITCWYTAMAFTTLLQASRTEHLREGAKANLDILMLAIKELGKMWATGKVLEQQFERVLGDNKPLTPEDFPSRHLGNDRSTRALHSEEEVLQSGIDWLDYFPFVTSQTSLVAEKLLAPQSMDEFLWDETSMLNCHDFLRGLDNWSDPNIFV